MFLFIVILASLLVGSIYSIASANFNDAETSTNNPANAVTNWYGSDWLAWQYRKKITIYNGTGSTLSNIQVKIAVDTYVPITTLGHMQADGDDIRFTASDGTTQLNYWIESGLNTNRTIIWVKITSLPANYSNIWLYYGNPSATAASNGYNTFIFFDDFEDDLSRWTAINPTRGTMSRVTATAQHGNYSMLLDDTSTGDTFGAYAGITSQTLCVIEYYAQAAQAIKEWDMQMRQTGNIGTNLRFANDASIEYNDSNNKPTPWHDFSPVVSYAAGTWYAVKLDKVDVSTDTYDVYVGGVKRNTNPVTFDTARTAINRIAFQTAVNADVPDLYIDLVKVRVYASSDPNVTAIGAENAE